MRKEDPLADDVSVRRFFSEANGTMARIADKIRNEKLFAGP